MEGAGTGRADVDATLEGNIDVDGAMAAAAMSCVGGAVVEVGLGTVGYSSEGPGGGRTGADVDAAELIIIASCCAMGGASCPWLGIDCGDCSDQSATG